MPTYYPDVSEFQVPYNGEFTGQVASFRFHSGYRVDANAGANWAWLSGALAETRVRVVIAYAVFIPGQLETVVAGLMEVFGTHCPDGLVLMVDMESGIGFAGPGNHSVEANLWAETFASYAGSWLRVVPYANDPDYGECWPQLDSRLTKRHVARYEPPEPADAYSWQYYGGVPGETGVPGAPTSCAPFGNCDMNVINRSVAEIEVDYGVAPAPIPDPPPPDPQETDMWLTNVFLADGKSTDPNYWTMGGPHVPVVPGSPDETTLRQNGVTGPAGGHAISWQLHESLLAPAAAPTGAFPTFTIDLSGTATPQGSTS